jgi:hypothetical protein
MQAGRCVASDFVSAYDEVRSRIVEHPQIGTPTAAETRKLPFRGFAYSPVYQPAPRII